MHKKTVSSQELILNLEILRGKIVHKPADYVPQNNFPHLIEDSFSRYIRTQNVNFVLSLSDLLRIEFDWPFPFIFLYLSKSKYWILKAVFPVMAWFYIRVWFKSLLDRSAEYEMRKAWFKKIIDKCMVKLVRLSSRELFRRWRATKILAEHHQKLNEIQDIYIKGYWYSCVTAVFPLLDYVCRELLHTDNLQQGVGHLNKVFSNANICLKSLRPGYGAWDYANEIGADSQETSSKDLRLVGIALESFLNFSKIYYGHYSHDRGDSLLNRHAILHGARGIILTKEDATRLLLFLDIMINLVPVFEILLATGSPHDDELRNDKS